MSEYAVWQSDAGNGTLLAAVAEAAFLIGLEKNRLIICLLLFFNILAQTAFLISKLYIFVLQTVTSSTWLAMHRCL